MARRENTNSAGNPYAPPASAEVNETPVFDYRVVVFWGCSVLLVCTAWIAAGLTLAAVAATCSIVVFWAAWRGKGYPPSTLVECWVFIAILWILWGLFLPAVEMRGRRRRVVQPPVQDAQQMEQADAPESVVSGETDSSPAASASRTDV